MKKIFLLSVCCLTVFTLNAQNLVFHTKFNNGQAADISSNNLNGIVNGAIACPGASGQANTALYFDGVNDYVEIPANTDLNLNKWTIHATVRPDGFNSQTCQTSGILWHGDQWSNQFYGLYICDNWYDNDCTFDSGEDAFGGLAAGSNTVDFESPWYTTNGYVTAGEWYCVVMTYDGDTMGLYINGDLVKKEPLSSNYNYSNPVSMIIGNGTAPGFYYWYKGAIDEVSVWDDAATLAQINNNICDSFLTTGSKIFEKGNGEVKLYPSPASDILYVETGNNWTGADWQLMNGLGQHVMEGSVRTSRNDIDISTLPAGIYIMKLSKGNMVQMSKVIKN